MKIENWLTQEKQEEIKWRKNRAELLVEARRYGVTEIKSTGF